MLRRIRQLFVLFSLMLCIGVGMCWVITHWYLRCRAVVFWTDDGSRITSHISVIGLASNGIYFGYSDEDFQLYHPQQAGQPLRQFLGKFAAAGDRHVFWTQSLVDVEPFLQTTNWTAGVSNGGHSINSRLDLWQYRTLMIIFGFLPVCWLTGRYRRWRRSKNRWRAGTCRRCRYDLRGNTSGVCPECGLRMALVDSPLWNELTP